MDEEKKIEKRLEKDFGFKKCGISKSESEEKRLIQNKAEVQFKAECDISYEETFTCEGQFNKEKGTLSKTNCEQKG